MSDLDRYLTDEMTDLNPELIEKSAIATYEEVQHPNWRAPLWGEIDEPGRERFLNAARAAIEAVLPDIIRQAKAEAWDEGYSRGFYDREALPGDSRDASEGRSENPYLDERTERADS